MRQPNHQKGCFVLGIDRTETLRHPEVEMVGGAEDKQFIQTEFHPKEDKGCGIYAYVGASLQTVR